MAIEDADTIERHVAAAVRTIEAQIAGLQGTGGLKMINQAYKTYRAAAAASGKGG